MATPDPNLAQQAGESWSNWQYRLQQLTPPTTGPNVRMAAGVMAFTTSPTVPKGFEVL